MLKRNKFCFMRDTVMCNRLKIRSILKLSINKKCLFFVLNILWLTMRPGLSEKISALKHKLK